MNTTEFDYELPQELIAQYPAGERDQSRLLAVDRRKGAILHSRFQNLPEFLQRGDLLVLNDTKVIPARLIGKKAGTGGRVELLLLEQAGKNAWKCMFKRGKRLSKGNKIIFKDGEFSGKVMEEVREGKGLVEFDYSGDFWAALERFGSVPLPPYIRRNEGRSFHDAERYQTVFARDPGSCAAPTAGLHFTEKVFSGLKAAGVEIAFVTLHVGPGTFLPIRAGEVERHRMEPEFFSVPHETVEALERARGGGFRVIPVGSTALRCIESAFRNGRAGPVERGYTDLFIYPGYEFQRVNGLITNFHLPRSTLFVLVCALAGTGLMKRAYREAVENRYRFYSYGDAMIIL